MNTFKIGCHLSSAGGFLAMGQTAVSIGANVFQFFTRNPRGGAARPIDPNDAAAFRAYAAEHGIGPILAHAPYTLNAAASDMRIRAFALATMEDDLVRMESVPGNYYNFHPGCHVGQGVAAGIDLISDLLNKILKPEQTTTVLLETMAGKGSEVGGKFEELRAIIDKVELSDHLGVCLDTCHVWDGGYDIASNLDEVLASFDKIVGLKRLRTIHLNDSLNVLGAAKDRHACIGKGKIGKDALARVINNPILSDLPFFLETPNDLDGYRDEIAMLRALR